MHPDKLDRAKLMSLVEKFGYDDIAAALRQRGGRPDPEQAYLTGNIEDIDDFAACKITRKEDWVDLYASPIISAAALRGCNVITAWLGEQLAPIFIYLVKLQRSYDPRLRLRIAPSGSSQEE